MTAPTILLRDLREDDRQRLLAWLNSPEVAAYMYSDHEISQAEHDRWFDGLAGDGRRRYWVIEVNGEPVGLANLADIAGQVKVKVRAEKAGGLDKSKLQNGVIEPLREANLIE